MKFRALRSSLTLTALAALACAGLTAPAAAEPDDTESTEAEGFQQLCVRAQVQTAKLRVVEFRHHGGELTEVPYTDPAAFAASKPTVQPLTVTSYTTYAATDPGLAKQVRCKGKSADHLTEVYGVGIAGPENDCAAVNRVTLRLINRSLTPAERRALVHKPGTVVIDADTQAVSGPDWLADFPVATVDSTGTLHLPSKALNVPLDTPNIPDAFKGQHYCTLIAPDYLKQLLLGRVAP
ncbi:hypothetical protein [Nocardia huaxiensis]|uniref:Uncharacterized protein n=1 Tax=Nocardia huaxiensis TaxID=2755382 RepID=A0A7D6V989_9NOCA|nr:hypothetical protein [Nocardia huaxiensis]QLY28802.1 hypothetical protein H0264_26190 [Nocardia huaxiensis]UFS97722.1 hypothetical protein LPY97_07410 [Nocardia huaxiensis]